MGALTAFKAYVPHPPRKGKLCNLTNANHSILTDITISYLPPIWSKEKEEIGRKTNCKKGLTVNSLDFGHTPT